MVVVAAMFLLLISCGVSQSKLDEQINGETAKADVIYMPYHEKIRDWGQLKAPTIEYDTSEFK